MTIDQEATKTSIGAMIREERTKRNLTVQQLASQVGLDQSYESKIELGYVQSPRRELLFKFAEVLGLELQDVLRAAGYIGPDGEERPRKPNTRQRGDTARSPQVGECIRSLRQAADLTQKELADRLDVNLQTLASWEAGAAPRTRYLHRLAEILGTTPEVLLGRVSPSDALKDPELDRYLNEIKKELETVPPTARVHLMPLLRQTIQAFRAAHEVEHNALARQTAVEPQSPVSPAPQYPEQEPIHSSTTEGGLSLADLEKSSTMPGSQELLEGIYGESSEGARHLAAIELDQE